MKTPRESYLCLPGGGIKKEGIIENRMLFSGPYSQPYPTYRQNKCTTLGKPPG